MEKVQLYTTKFDVEDALPKRPRRDLMKVHVFKEYWDSYYAAQHADAIGANYDLENVGDMIVLSICGTFLQLTCVQSFVDGRNSRRGE